MLVTDGYPTQCEPRGISAIAKLAEEAHSREPYVRTFVIGLAAEYNLDSIARSGGTRRAYRVDEGDPTGSFLLALRNVSNSKLACRYEIPEPPGDTMKLDFRSSLERRAATLHLSAQKVALLAFVVRATRREARARLVCGSVRWISSADVGICSRRSLAP